MQIKNTLKSIVYFSIMSLFIACGGGDKSGDDSAVISKRTGVNDVIIRMSADPDKLNIVTGTSAGASEVQKHMFESLMLRNPATLAFEPLAAKAAGVKEEIIVDFAGEKTEGLKFSYEIRDEAKFDDGSPITGHDIAFYVKCIKNPQVDCDNIRPYLESLIDVEVDAENPKKVAFVFKDKYFVAEEIAAEAWIMQRSLYDVDGLMKNYSIRELSDPKNFEKLSADKTINEFANMFNGEKFAREAIYSSGPYTFKSWVTGERIILEKNNKWWGNSLVGKESQFSNYPDKVVFEIISDATTALTAQKDEGVDLMAHRSKDYLDLNKDKNFLKKYRFVTPLAPSYGYIGLNTRKPYLADKRVRQALTMAIDYETIKEVFLYGMADRTACPVHPKVPYYNNEIVPYPFDMNKATSLLEEAGWEDTDEDGIRDKEVGGEQVDLIIEFKYPSGGSKYGENVALLLKESYAKLGVELEIVSKEWTVFLEDTKSHNFDMAMNGWVMGAGLSDMKQLWHTESQNGGSNYVGFGNAYTDELIEKIRFELDEEKRNKLYFEIQEIIHDEAPYIFLFTGKKRMAIHKRFDNAEGYGVRPGYDFTKFQLNTSWGSASTQIPE